MDPGIPGLVLGSKSSTEGGQKGPLLWCHDMHPIVCSQDFRKGMNLYLTKFLQKNAATGN